MQDDDADLDTEMPDRILRIRSVLKYTGLSRSSMYRRIEKGTFPGQVQISDRCVGWRLSAIKAWLRNPMFYTVDDHPGT